ncbi:type II toxin-antitoxin system RelE/ParE family toxin [Isosphaeraceae bacterium EP7]
MNLPVILGPPAALEFKAGVDWYEREAGLGEAFLDRVNETLDRIGRMPELHAPIFAGIRRARVERFPYHVFYRILEDRVEVLAIHHSSRDPKNWKDRA